MALVDFANISGDDQQRAEQAYLDRHYEAVYLRRRALDQQRNRPPGCSRNRGVTIPRLAADRGD
jgi:hypothetical protein